VAAPPFLEIRDDRLDAVQHRADVDRHHLVDVLVGQFQHRPHDAAAGVVDPDVNAAECVERLVADPSDVSAARNVGDDDANRHSERLSDLRHRVRVARGEHETVAAPRQLARGGGADAALPPSSTTFASAGVTSRAGPRI
jgi:hypothetical protein